MLTLQACMSFTVIKKGTAYYPSQKKTGARNISEVPVEMRSKNDMGLTELLEIQPDGCVRVRPWSCYQQEDRPHQGL